MVDRQRLCFVIGPIGKDHSPERKHADMILHSVIEPVLRADPFNYEVRRADKAEDPGMVLNDIIKGLLEAPLVVADLSFQNPNVFWELGIRHAATKAVICLAAVGTDIPFDAQGHRVIFIDLGDWHSQEEARKRLSAHAAEIDKKDFKVSNPITQAKGYIEMRESGDPKETLVAKLEERLSRLERNLQRNFRYASSELRNYLVHGSPPLSMPERNRVELIDALVDEHKTLSALLDFTDDEKEKATLKEEMSAINQLLEDMKNSFRKK